MPSINMITARRAEKRKLEKKIRVAMLVIVCEVALTVVVFSFMTACIFRANGRLDELNVELRQLQPTVEKIKSYEAEIKNLKPRLDLLADSREATLVWYRVLHDLGRCMPEKTWLISVTSTVPSATAPTPSTTSGTTSAPQKPAQVVSLKGTSVSQRLVGETMLRLNDCTEFDKISLNYTQKGNDQKKDTLDFEVVAQLAPIDEPKGGTQNVSD